MYVFLVSNLHTYERFDWKYFQDALKVFALQVVVAKTNSALRRKQSVLFLQIRNRSYQTIFCFTIQEIVTSNFNTIRSFYCQNLFAIRNNIHLKQIV